MVGSMDVCEFRKRIFRCMNSLEGMACRVRRRKGEAGAMGFQSEAESVAEGLLMAKSLLWAEFEDLLQGGG